MSGLLKHAMPVWTRIPGTPFTLPGMYRPKERLPGMSEWAPRDAVERVSKMLKERKNLDEIAQSERGEGLSQSLGIGGVVGTTAGGLLGRLIGGEASVSPFKKILSQGLTKQTFSGLRGLPGAMKLLPALGAGAGLLAGGAQWGAGKEQRGEQSKDIGRGLLAERVLQRGALGEAIKTDKPYHAPILRGVPVLSASSAPPYVAIPGSTGI